MLLKVHNPLEQCQLKFDSESGEFEGYASVFNSNDQVNDTILPGAFHKSLESGKSIKMFFNHDHRAVPIGDWVTMKEDDRGLFATGRIDLNHKDGPTVYSGLKRGAVDGLSIGFTASPDDFEAKEAGRGRTYHNLDLKETSVVSFPCEEGARISAVKSEIEALKTVREIEQFLRDEGFSISQAKALIGVVTKHSRDEGGLQDRIAEYEAAIKHLKGVIARLRSEHLFQKIYSKES